MAGETCIAGLTPEATKQIIRLLQSLVPESIGPSAVIPFQKSVAVSYQDEEDKTVSFKSKVAQVIMAFPAGCQQLVEVRLLYLPAGGGRINLVPTLDDVFIALDDFTTVFYPNKIIEPPGKLRAEWYNYDSQETHSVPVIVTLEPVAKEAAVV